MKKVPKLTREQAAIIGAYTGVAVGPFEDIHKLIEQTLNMPVQTIQLADQDFMKDKVLPVILPLLIEIAATK